MASAGKGPKRIWREALTATLAMLLPGMALAEPAVVLASSAPGSARGQLVDTGGLIVPDGATVTLLLASGRSIDVHGPHDGPVNTAAQGAGRLQRLMATASDDSSDLGGTRSVDNERAVIEPAQGGTWCRKADELPLLRLPASGNSELTLRDLGNGRIAAVALAAEPVAWPEALPLAGDETELSVMGEPGGERRLRLRTVKPAAPGKEALAASYAMAGCQSQAAELLERLRDTKTSLALYLATDRGRFPSYEVGEPISFVMQSNRAAWIYCDAVTQDRRHLLLFPPEPGAAWVPAETPVRLLATGKNPTPLRAGELLGEGEVRCVALGDERREERPDLGGVPALAPLPARLAMTLDQLARAGERPGVAMAALTLRLAR